MNRRGFIQSFVGAAAMAAVPNMKQPTLLHDAAHHDLTEGFGLAPIKREGAAVAFDPGSSSSYVLTKKRKILMKAFGLDPEDPAHVSAYLEGCEDDDRARLEIAEVYYFDDDDEEETDGLDTLRG